MTLKLLEIYPPPACSLALGVPCWYVSAPQTYQAFPTSGLLHIFSILVDGSLASLCTWLSFAHPLGLS